MDPHPSRTWLLVAARLLTALGYQLLWNKFVGSLSGSGGSELIAATTAMPYLFPAIAVVDVVGWPIGGLLTDSRVGPKYAALIGATAFAVGFGVMTAETVPLICAGFALISLGGIVLRPALLIMLGDGYGRSSPPRVAAFAAEAAGLTAAVVLAHALWNASGIYVVAAALSIGAAGLIALLGEVPRPPGPADSHPDARKLLGVSAGIVVAFLLLRWAAGKVALNALLSTATTDWPFEASVGALPATLLITAYWTRRAPAEYARLIAAAFVTGFAVLAIVVVWAVWGAEALPHAYSVSQAALLVADAIVLPAAFAIATAAVSGRWRATVFGLWSIALGTRALLERIDSDVDYIGRLGPLVAVVALAASVLLSRLAPRIAELVRSSPGESAASPERTRDPRKFGVGFVILLVGLYAILETESSGLGPALAATAVVAVGLALAATGLNGLSIAPPAVKSVTTVEWAIVVCLLTIASGLGSVQLALACVGAMIWRSWRRKRGLTAPEQQAS